MKPGVKKWLKRGPLILILLGLAFAGWFYGPLAYGLWQKGFFGKTSDAHRYEGTSIDNLKFIRTALLGYEDSEGQFPAAGGWMDAIQNRLGTDDLKAGEAAKKLVRPDFYGQQGKYGYAFNQALAGKYRGDIKDQRTPMVFESASSERNAHGDPVRLRKPGGLAVTVGGDILH